MIGVSWDIALPVRLDSLGMVLSSIHRGAQDSNSKSRRNVKHEKQQLWEMLQVGFTCERPYSAVLALSFVRFPKMLSLRHSISITWEVVGNADSWAC